MTTNQVSVPMKNYAKAQREARSMRRTGPTAIVHNGGKQTIFGCLCGSRHTASTDWDGRNARHVQVWQQEHAEACTALYERIAAKRSADWLEARRAAIYNAEVA